MGRGHGLQQNLHTVTARHESLPGLELGVLAFAGDAEFRVALTEPRGGIIAADYFDIDKSQSIPWPRRPQASALQPWVSTLVRTTFEAAQPRSSPAAKRPSRKWERKKLMMLD